MCSNYQTFFLRPYSRDQEALSKQPCGVKSRNEQQGEAIAFGKAGSESAMERWKHVQNVLKRMLWARSILKWRSVTFREGI